MRRPLRSASLALAILVGSQTTVACTPNPYEAIENLAKAAAAQTQQLILNPLGKLYVWAFGSDLNAPDPRTVPRVPRNVRCDVTVGVPIPGARDARIYFAKTPNGIFRLHYQTHDPMARWMPQEWYRICHPPAQTFGAVTVFPTTKLYRGVQQPNDPRQTPVLRCRTFTAPDFGTGMGICYTADAQITNPSIYVRAYVPVL